MNKNKKNECDVMYARRKIEEAKEEKQKKKYSQKNSGSESSDFEYGCKMYT